MKWSMSLMLAFCALFASADDLAGAVHARLTQANVLRGEFEQTKHVAGFKKPLVSHGDFLVARGRGVVWRTKDPFASVLKLTRNEIVATQGKDVAFRLDADKEPSVRVINGLMFSLLDGDVSALSEQFSLKGDVTGKTWDIDLTPKQAGLAKVMTHVHLGGDQFVRRIQIDEANGDQTDIRFTAQRTEPATMTAEEAARFE